MIYVHVESQSLRKRNENMDNDTKLLEKVLSKLSEGDKMIIVSVLLQIYGLPILIKHYGIKRYLIVWKRLIFG